SVDPRRMWPAGMAAADIDVSGKIAVGQRAEPGRVLGRLSDIGWGQALRTLLNGGDTEVDESMFAAIVKVLAAWDWQTRPDTVVSMGSRSRPLLVDGLARRLAQVGRMDYAGAVVRDPDAAYRTGNTNSAQRLKQVWGTFTAPSVPEGTAVVLADDRPEAEW